MSFLGPPADAAVMTCMRRVASIDLLPREIGQTCGPLSSVQLGDLVAAAAGRKMLGLLAVAVDRGIIRCSQEQADRVYAASAEAIRGDLRREDLLLEVATLLDAAGTPFRVLKGPATAHLDERDPMRRSFRDIDLLIPGPQFASTVAALESDGFRREYPEPRPGFDGRFSKGVALRRGHEEVDLHRTLAPGPFGMAVRVEDLWREEQPFDLGGHRFSALAPSQRLIHAAYHAVLGGGPPRWAALRDIALIANRRDVDTGEIATLAQRWRGTAVVREAVEVLRSTLDCDVLTLRSALEAAPIDPWESRALQAYGDGPGRYARQSYATLTAMHSASDRLRYLGALLLPRKEYVQPRHKGRLSRLADGFRAVSRRSP